jgi:hypothetical protein
MDDDTPSEPAPRKPSQVPSWVTLGFVLGALFVLALPRRSAETAPRPAAAEEAPAPARTPEAPRLTTIEAVFAAWGRYAVWSDGTAEVALWSPDTKSFSEFYEVTRVGEDYYFRSITSLSRLILTHGVPEDSPLQFTETARQREEWLGEVGKEKWKAIGEGVRQSLAPTSTTSAAPPADDGK